MTPQTRLALTVLTAVLAAALTAVGIAKAGLPDAGVLIVLPFAALVLLVLLRGRKP
jgi:hypothetical protein